ncbi:MAG: hypothetical protein MUQ65_03345, partial [Armatimonadetes bacterium]|nr:hypothetical protein [Armatimonadota bacterium]
VVGCYFNPLVTLHGYADSLASQDMAELWLVNKLALLAIGIALYVVNRRLLTCPPAPRRWVAAVRAGVVIVLVLVVYVASGAVYKVAYGIRHEGELGRHARMWYQQQFRGYGPLPVAWMFGPAFARYVQAEVGRDVALAQRGGGALLTSLDVPSMRWILEQSPDSIWADNAQFELAVQAGRRQASRPWAIIVYEAGPETADTIVKSDDVAGGARELGALADVYPESPFAPLALAEAAAARLSLLDFEGARAAYERILSDHPASVQSCEAGLALAPLSLREGDHGKALRAADVAAGTAPWDRRAEALVLAARAASRSGQRDIAEDRYRRAEGAAQEAIARSYRGEKTPSRVTKRVLFPVNNAIITEAKHALAGRAAAAAIREPGVVVCGRVMTRGEGIEATRVALGGGGAEGGLPSPFGEGVATSAAVEADGSFVLPALPEGRYRVLACTLRTDRESADLQVKGPRLPLDIAGPWVELPALETGIRRVEAAPPSSRARIQPAIPQGRGSDRSRGRGGRSGGRRG